MSKLRSFNIEYANFVCHFGNQVLLDRYFDIFYPAITSGEVRSYNETIFSFLDIEHIELKSDNEGEEPEYFLYGKIVKDFIYKREQILDYNKHTLEDAPEELRDCPSSTFILSLKDHRLYFIKEFQLGPTLEQFKQLIETVIKKYTTKLIDDEYQSKKEMRNFTGSGRVPSKKSLRVNFPLPDLNIIKLSSPEGIKEFVNNIKTINLFELTINKPNHENDLTGIFKVLREQNDHMGIGVKNKVSYTKSKKSLNHHKVIELAEAASRDNNINFRVRGIDVNGGTIGGTEEEFSAKVPINELEDTPKMMVKKCFESFWELVNKGVVSEPRVTNIKETVEKIKSLMKLLQ